MIRVIRKYSNNLCNVHPIANATIILAESSQLSRIIHNIAA